MTNVLREWIEKRLAEQKAFAVYFGNQEWIFYPESTRIEDDWLIGAASAVDLDAIEAVSDHA